LLIFALRALSMFVTFAMILQCFYEFQVQNFIPQSEIRIR